MGKILPKFPTDHRHKRGAIIASVLGGIAASVIGLAYEGISSFHKRHKALHKAVAVMNKMTNTQHNKIQHLENTMIMYGVYNSDTLKDLIDTVHRLQNFTTWNEKTFTGKLHDWIELYSHSKGVHHLLCKAVLSICEECLEVSLLHVFICTSIHNCSSSGSLFFASLRQNN